ncbi:hypothetical protein JTB14_012650 [Gonioctena quinquepunctata]|nr:hypothetical protein JTB14_012650 [Gonioctena quinquepunctata]
MRAVQFWKNERRVELAEIPIPEITEPDDVLIKVAYCGICGTDLHIIEGEFPCIENKPLTLGHEFSGTVVEVAENVVKFREGDKVVVDPNNSCQCCKFCHSGNPHFCPVTDKNLGTFRNGGFAEYVVVPAHTVHKLPDSITLEQGALAEPLSCLSHGLDIIGPIPVGSKVLIVGAGIIGTLWVCVLHSQGHRTVTVCEPKDARLAILKNLSTGYTLLNPFALEEKRKADPQYFFDVIIDCSGYSPAIELALSLLRKNGILCCFGVASPNATISMRPFDIFMKELRIYAVKVNPFSFPKALGLIESMGERYLNYGKLGIIFELDDFKDALDKLKKGSFMKAIFKM